MSRDFYQLLRSYGGISLEYIKIEEADFTATAGSAYLPPERGSFRRIAGSRQVQLLSDAPGVVETFQTSDAEVFLPANTLADNTNDAGNGRIFFFKNSGSFNISIKDYTGATLYVAHAGQSLMVVGNELNSWDFFDFSGRGAFPIQHITNGVPADNQWLSYYNTMTGTGSWIIVPCDCTLQAMTWVNRNTGVDFDLEFYKNGTVSPTNLIKIFSVTNSTSFYALDKDWGIDLLEGDLVRVKYKSTGTDVRDMTTIYYFQKK